MRYDDTIRQYNFLAGLGAGALLGMGIALLAIPQKRVLRRQLRVVGGRRAHPAGDMVRTISRGAASLRRGDR